MTNGNYKVFATLKEAKAARVEGEKIYEVKRWIATCDSVASVAGGHWAKKYAVGSGPAPRF